MHVRSYGGMRLHVVALAVLGMAVAAPAQASIGAFTTGNYQAKFAGPTGDSGGGKAATVTPDLFSGTFSYSIPIDVPRARRGMEPDLSLTYRSGHGDGWVGLGWSLELGAVERSTKRGVRYDTDNYVLKTAAGATELTKMPGGEFRAVIESSFVRVRKLAGNDGLASFEVTDRNGVKYVYGTSSATRQADPADATRIFRWCLERVEDPNGNFATFSYVQDQGAVYPDRIDYGGGPGQPSTAYVKFYLASVGGAVSYATNFPVRATYRLQTIEIVAGTSPSTQARVRAYSLQYGVGRPYSSRALLVSVQQYGADAVIEVGRNGGMVVTGGTALPASTFNYNGGGVANSYSGVAGPVLYMTGDLDGARHDIGRVFTGDFDGDGRMDVAIIEGWASPEPGTPINIYYSNGNGGYEVRPGPSIPIPGDHDGLVDLEFRLKVGDFNGDGKTDIAFVEGFATAPPGTWMRIYYAQDGRTFGPRVYGPIRYVGETHVKVRNDAGRVMVGDFNGDGKMDLIAIEGWGADTGCLPMTVYLSNGNGFDTGIPSGPTTCPGGDDDGLTTHIARFKLGDFDGDGKTDIAMLEGWDTGSNGAAMSIWFARDATKTDGTGFAWTAGPVRLVGETHEKVRNDAGRLLVGDFNGDGKMDFAAIEGWGQCVPMQLYLANGHGFDPGIWTGPTTCIAGDDTGVTTHIGRFRVGDFNGDGKSDIAFIEGWQQIVPMSIYFSTGDAISSARIDGPIRTLGETHDLVQLDCSRVMVGDLNGDGKDDFLAIEGWLAIFEIARQAGDYAMSYYLSPSAPMDLLATANNGRGATTTVGYTPSTAYANTLLPFPVQTVSSIRTDTKTYDLSVTSGTTSITYSGGYFYIADRDFRGFSYVKVTNPAGPNGEQIVNETSFHQGNDVAPGVNDPYVSTGYMKGKPWKVKISDVANPANYSETITTYWADAVSTSAPWVDADGYAPWFTPTQRVETTTYEAGALALQTRTEYPNYDNYGNVTREERYGDTATSNDNVTIVRTFQPNTTAWILALPATEDIYHGSVRFSGKSFYYDGIATVAPGATDVERAAACNNVSTNATPTVGNLTRTLSWNCYANDWTVPGNSCTVAPSPETRAAYDTLGNQVCSRSPRGAVTTTRYDSTAAYPTVVTNTLGHQVTTTYYGIDGVAQDYGFYGQVKSVSDPNQAVTTSYYDKLGRMVREVAPGATKTDGSGLDVAVATWQYGSYVSDGDLQYVRTGVYSLPPPVDATTPIYESVYPPLSWNESYADGLGRTVKHRRSGPGTPSAPQVVVQTKSFDARGAVTAESLPYRENSSLDTPRFNRYTYDAAGRVTSAVTPSGTSLACYSGSTAAVKIDEMQHRKRETRDAQGHLVKVQEYKGTYPTCTPDVGSPYATTTYDYDGVGHLAFVTDARGNKTKIQYDSLGRKRYVHDPDAGEIEYRYDDDGNLVWQQDPVLRAKNYAISFSYDLLDRMMSKTYPTGTGITFDYDTNYDTGSDVPPAAPIGRLTRMTDASGVETYRYDAKGRVSRSVKTVGGTSYPIRNTYDALNRLASLTYHDGEVVNYSYDLAGNLLSAGSYATFSGYNALGQAQTVQHGNGVTTTYGYYDTTDSRLRSALVCLSSGGTCSQPPYVSLTYGYDAVGNVMSLTDAVDSTRSYGFGYDELNRLTSAQSGRTGALSYDYDTIGNITLKEGITYTYSTTAHSLSGTTGDRPHAVLSTTNRRSFKYDSNGNTLNDSVRTIVYDWDNRPTSVTMGKVTTTFVYDGVGNRVKKTASTGTITYVGKLLECTASACGKYIFAGDTRVALKTGTDVKYYHPNHLGSTVLVTGATGNSLEQLSYYPYGTTVSDTGSVSMNHKFTGQELDPESGLYFYIARYYDPALGRFVSPDTLVPDPSNPQQFNRYTYALNNPLLYTDPTGHMTLRELFGTREGRRWLATGAIIAVTAAVTVASSGATLPMLIGEINGAYTGAKAAKDAGGDESKGALLGTIIGGATAQAGSWAGGTLIGNGSFWNVVVARTVEGAIVSAGLGAAVGYGGGRGDIEDIAWGAAVGAGTGAVTGAALGVAEGRLAAYDAKLEKLEESLSLKPAEPVANNGLGTSQNPPKPLVKDPGMYRDVVGESHQLLRSARGIVATGWVRSLALTTVTGAALTRAPWLTNLLKCSPGSKCTTVDSPW